MEYYWGLSTQQHPASSPPQIPLDDAWNAPKDPRPPAPAQPATASPAPAAAQVQQPAPIDLSEFTHLDDISGESCRFVQPLLTGVLILTLGPVSSTIFSPYLYTGYHQYGMSYSNTVPTLPVSNYSSLVGATSPTASSSQSQQQQQQQPQQAQQQQHPHQPQPSEPPQQYSLQSPMTVEYVIVFCRALHV